MIALARLRDIVGGAIEQTKARSCTFYIQDPWWPGDLKLLYMPGVTITEPMHGFLFPRISKDRVTKGTGIERISDASTDWRTFDRELPKTVRELTTKYQIYGNFAVREGVRACCRTVIRGERNELLGAYFLNFSEAKAVENIADATLEAIRDDFRQAIPDAIRELEATPPLAIKKLPPILDSTFRLANLDSNKTNQSDLLADFFRELLATAVEAYGLAREGGFGSIHSFDSATEVLRLEASYPSNSQGIPQRLACKDGMGVVSWVALKGKPLLIQDLSRSTPFQQIYVKAVEGVRSELALPLVAGDRVVGVLNLESMRENAFQPEDVRVLWYAANHAALAFQLRKLVFDRDILAARTRELLETCRDIVKNDRAHENSATATGEHLNRLAGLLAEWGEADMCDLWGYDTEKDRFWGAGANSRHLNTEQPPRGFGIGFSRFVIAKKKPVLINDVRSVTDFRAFHWDGENGWIPNDGSFPQTVSDNLQALNVRAEIGIPILSNERAIGVAWLKFKSDLLTMPTSDLIRHAEGLVASVALVMEFLQKHDESIRASEENFRKRLSDYNRQLFSKKEEIPPGLDFGVTSVPISGTIGGDFWGLHRFENQERLAVILGDGEGHGIEGTLQMLPLYTAFRIVCGQTTSTHYVLEKMNEVGRSLEVRGTALYFILDRPYSNRDEWIVSASVAGDAPPLIILSPKTGNIRHFPQDPESIQTKLGVPIPPPLGESLTKCFAGDVIVAVSDGVKEVGQSDADNRAEFGFLGITAALTQLLKEKPGASAQEIADNIFHQARRHGTVFDDATIAVCRIVPTTK